MKIGTDLLREYEEGEAVCWLLNYYHNNYIIFISPSGQSLYCSLILAKYKTKYQ